MGDNHVHGVGARWVVAATLMCIVAMPRTGAAQGSIGTPRVAAAVANDAVRITVHVSVQVDDVPVAVALRMIAKQARLVLALNTTSLPANARVTLNVNDIPADKAFERALQGTGLAARINGVGDVFIVPLT